MEVDVTKITPFKAVIITSFICYFLLGYGVLYSIDYLLFMELDWFKLTVLSLPFSFVQLIVSSLGIIIANSDNVFKEEFSKTLLPIFSVSSATLILIFSVVIFSNHYLYGNFGINLIALLICLGINYLNRKRKKNPNNDINSKVVINQYDI